MQILQTGINNGRAIAAANKNILPILAILTAVFLWGSSFASMRVVLVSLPPMSMMWLRMVIALSLILPLLTRLIPKDYQKGDWKIILPMVLTQPCLYFFLESNALRFTTSSQAGVISAFVPLLVVLGAWMFLAEVINWKIIFGLLMSISGVVVLTLSGKPDGLAVNPVLGNILELGAMCCGAANILLVKQLCSRYNPWTLTAMQVVAGSLFFLPGLSFILQSDPGLWDLKLIFFLVFLGAFVTLGAFGLYNWGISKINASRASLFINLIPVTAVIIGWLALGEALNLPQSIASMVILAGVIASQLNHKY